MWLTGKLTRVSSFIIRENGDIHGNKANGPRDQPDQPATPSEIGTTMDTYLQLINTGMYVKFVSKAILLSLEANWCIFAYKKSRVWYM